MSGVDVSELTAEEANDKVARFVADYLLTIDCREDQKYNITGPSIGYAYVPNGEIEQILAQQEAADWIKQRKTQKKQDIRLDTTYRCKYSMFSHKSCHFTTCISLYFLGRFPRPELRLKYLLVVFHRMLFDQIQ